MSDRWSAARTLTVGLRTSVLLCIALSVTQFDAHAQTPVGISNVTGDIEPRAAGIAANNPWFGAQLVHRFDSGGEFASNLLAAGQFVYDVPLGATAFRLPVISNFGGKIAPTSDLATVKESIDTQFKELLDSAAGVTAGVFPYYPIAKNDTLMLTIHGMAAWRYNALKPFGEPAAGETTEESSQLVDLHQIKFGVGAEIVVGKRDNGPAAITFGVTPVWTKFRNKDAYRRAFGEEKSGLSAVEIVGILPLQANGLGLVFENVTGGGQNAFRIGLMIAGQP